MKTSHSIEAPPFSLIEQKSLLSRLAEEISRAAIEFARDPRAFIGDLLTDDTRDLKRQRRMRALLASALAFHLVLLGAIVVAGWIHFAKAKTEINIVWVPPSDVSPKTADKPENKAEDELPRGSKNSGGGGSGRNAPTEASHGALPRSIPQPPMIIPNAPILPDPKLAISPSIQGPETPPIDPNALIGDPNAKMDAPPSPGTGTGGGPGDGEGDGVGGGKGSGGDKGNRAGRGGGSFGDPNGRESGLNKIPYNRIAEIARGNPYTPFSWIYRARAIITPEAQANKVVGTVLVRATLRADGVITDIEVVNPVEFMTESALESLKRCKFRPAMLNGQPITLTRVPIQINVHY
ncbi:MAG: energy transducer TonB [Acidobacteriota bacterium]